MWLLWQRNDIKRRIGRRSCDDLAVSPVVVNSAEEHPDGLQVRDTARCWQMRDSAELSSAEVFSLKAEVSA